MSEKNIELGSIIYIAVKPIFKIYLIIGVGFYLARKNILSVDTSRNMSAMAILVLIPCLTFTKIVTNIDNADIKQIGTIVIISSFMMISSCILTFIVGVLAGSPKSWYGGLLSVGLLPNISDLPISYLQGMENANIFENVDKGVSYICIYMVMQTMVQFNFGAFKLIEFDFRHEIKRAKRMALIEQQKSEVEHDDEDDEDYDREAIIESLRSTNNRKVPTSTGQSVIDDDPISSINSSDDEQTQQSVVNASRNSLPSIDKNNAQHMQFLQRKSATASGPAPLNTLNKIPSNASRRLSSSSQNSRNQHSLHESVYSNDLRQLPSQRMDDVVRLYSRFDELAGGGVTVEDPSDIQFKHNKPEPDKEANDSDSDDEVSLTTIFKSIERITFRKFINFLKQLGKMLYSSMLKPVSIAVVVSIVVCMVPWLRALFVINSQARLSPAPDGQPPLSFIMDFTSYIANAQVPIGLLLLGGTIGRLEVSNLPKGIWKAPLAITIFKLMIFPVIGCALNSKINKDGLFYNEDILYLVSNINFCLPPATSLIYITAFYTPVGSEEHLQIDCLALCYIAHYILLVVCLPFTTSYTLKVSLGY